MRENEETRTRTAAEYLDARTYRVELILLGMALARDGDRDRILDSISHDDLSRDSTQDLLLAVADKDLVQVKRFFKGIGVEISAGETILEAVVGWIHGMNAKRTAAEHVARLLSTAAVDDLEEIEERLKESLATVQGLKH